MIKHQKWQHCTKWQDILKIWGNGPLAMPMPPHQKPSENWFSREIKYFV